MNFKKATDELFNSVSHDELAEAVGVSVASIRQARLDREAKAHRSPPLGWEKAVLKLAEAKARRFERLAAGLRRNMQPKSKAIVQNLEPSGGALK